MPGEASELARLEQQRARLYGELGGVGDFRRGSLNEVRRRCGKPNCACADPGHPGHGPQYNFTRSVGGKTRNVHLKVGPELTKLRGELANYERFKSLVAQVSEVNEAICDARPIPTVVDEASGGPGAEKGGSSPGSRRTSPPR